MKRVTLGLLIALLILVVLAPRAVAQAPEEPADPAADFAWPRFSITAFVGARAGFDPEIDRVVTSSSGTLITSTRARFEAEGSPVVGVEVDARLAGPFSLIASVARDPGGDVAHRVDGDLFPAPEDVQVEPAWFGKLDLGIWLREEDDDAELRRYHPAGALFAGLAARRVEPEDVAGIEGDFEDPYMVWGANFGVKAETPIGYGVVLQLALEDYWTFWDEDRLEELTEARWRAAGQDVQVQVEQDDSQLVVARIGLSLRL